MLLQRYPAMCDLGMLYLLCGKMAAGKSTLARELASSRHAILLSEDQLLADLYPNEVQDVASYAQCSARLKGALESHIGNLLCRGVSVVLDFPANTVRQRKWMQALIAKTGARHELHYVIASDAMCKSRLAKRNAEQPDRKATDTVEMFDSITAHFQAPTPDEGFHLIRHERS
jgi:predicted kinase